jgi:hypothetical protein
MINRFFFLRERYLNAVCTLGVTDTINKDVLFRVLRTRLDLLAVFSWIVAFTMDSSDEQLDFFLADEDKKQWQVQMALMVCRRYI